MPTERELEALCKKNFSGYCLVFPVNVLGKGGMATVYAGQDRRTKGRVAIRVLDSSIHEDYVRAEMSMCDAIQPLAAQCPHLVLPLAWADNYIVLERLDGMNLQDLIQEAANTGNTIDLITLLTIFLHICRALSALHGAGIVHRDVKAENIFVTTADDLEVRAKLIDYGIACFMSQSRQANHSVWGTPGKMSPEQFFGARLDGRADIYSLGVAMYEAICDEPLYEETIPPMASDTPDCVWSAMIWKTIDPEVRALVASMIQPDGEKRPASAEAVADTIEKLIERLSASKPRDCLPPLINRSKIPRAIQPLCFVTTAPAPAKLQPTAEAQHVHTRSPRRGVPNVIGLVQLGMTAVILTMLLLHVLPFEIRSPYFLRPFLERVSIPFSPATDYASAASRSASVRRSTLAQAVTSTCYSRHSFSRREHLRIAGVRVPDRGCWDRPAVDKKRKQLCRGILRRLAEQGSSDPNADAFCGSR